MLYDDPSYGVWSWLCFFLFLLFNTISITTVTRRNNRRDKQPPGPRGLPLFGYLPFLGTDLHREFTKLSDTYGPIYKLRLGKKLCVVISSPTIAKEIVRDQDVLFADRDATVASLTLTYGGYDIAFANYGEYWRKMRKIFVQEMMSNKSIEDGSDVRRVEVRKLIRRVYNSSKVGESGVIDSGAVALRTIVNATMAMVWGSTPEEDQLSEFREAFAEAMLVLGNLISLTSSHL